MRYLSKKNLLILAITLIVGFLLGLIYIFINVKKVELDASSRNEIINVFNQNYSFSDSKNTSKVYYSFTGSKFEQEILSFLNKVNESEVKFANLEVEYSKATSTDFNVLKVDSLPTEFNVSSLEDINTFNLNSELSKDLKYKIEEVDKSFLFDSKTLVMNSFSGYLNKFYFLQCDGNKVLNLGSLLQGNISKSNISKNTTLIFNTNKDCNVTERFSVPIQTYTEFTASIKNNKLFMYEFIGNLSFENPEELANKSISSITIDSISKDLIYIQESSMMVPLISLKGKVNYTNETYDTIQFWAWNIKSN